MNRAIGRENAEMKPDLIRRPLSDRLKGHLFAKQENEADPLRMPEVPSDHRDACAMPHLETVYIAPT